MSHPTRLLMSRPVALLAGFLLASATYMAPAAAQTVEVPITLQLDANNSPLQVEVEALGDFDSDSTNIGGFLNGRLELDTSGSMPVAETLFIDSGRIEITDDLGFNISALFVLNIDILASGLAGGPSFSSFDTLTPTATPGTSTFNAGFFPFTFDEGTLSVSGTVSDSLELSSFPVSGTTPFGTLGELSLVEAGTSGGMTNYDVNVELPLTFSDVFTVPLGLLNVEVTLDLDGVITADAAFGLENAAPIPGDFDADGDVDSDDLSLWQQNYGQAPGATTMQGDADNDGDVDGNDLLVWQRNFGQGTGSLVATSVPEPSTLALMMLAAVGWLAYKR